LRRLRYGVCCAAFSLSLSLRLSLSFSLTFSLNVCVLRSAYIFSQISYQFASRAVRYVLAGLLAVSF
jgi:hypothetical protein